jgi:FkbM family methyltransferase
MSYSTISESNHRALQHASSIVPQARTFSTQLEQNNFVLNSKRAYPFRGFVDITVSNCDSFVMFCNNDDPVALHYFWCGPDAWEPTSLNLWGMLCSSSSGAILDVGSFSGLYSLVAWRKQKERVIAFEPSRMPLVRLLDNINANGASKIEVVTKAATDFNGATSFQLARGLRTLSTAGSLGNTGGEGLSEPVDAVTVDAELDRRAVERVSLVKIDVEGAEISALQGMSLTLQKDQPDLLIEVRTSLRKKIFEFLSEYGYVGLCVIESTGTLLDVVDAPQSLQNFYFSVNRNRILEYKNKFCE